MDVSGAVTLIAALAAATVAIINAVKAKEVPGTIKKVHEELRTFNKLTVGQLAAKDETRRIEGVSPEDRTDQEMQHLIDDRNPPNDHK